MPCERVGSNWCNKFLNVLPSGQNSGIMQG